MKTLYAYLDLNLYGNKIKSELSKVETSIEKTKEFLEKNPNSTKKINRLKTDEEYYQSLQKKIENISNLYSKYGNEVPLACCLFIEYGKEVVYLVGASNYECRNFKGPYAVQWEMIQQAIKKGYTYYNFYGISGYYVYKSTSPNSGYRRTATLAANRTSVTIHRSSSSGSTYFYIVPYRTYNGKRYLLPHKIYRMYTVYY